MPARTPRVVAVRPRLTREGWWFLAATAVVGAVALNAGLNLFFLAFGILLCLGGASFALAALALAGLRVRRVLPLAVFAGTPYLMGISLGNSKRRLPSFSIEVEDLVEDRPIDKRCYFLKLPAGRTQETAYRNVAARRGRQRLTGFRLATKFPFGLFQRTRLVADAGELIVYPALAAPPVELARRLGARPGPGPERGHGRQGEFAGLRAFRAGDDPHDIHWRSSARRGHPMVREHDEDQARDATVLLDNAEHAGRDEAAFERAVSEAAGLCVDLVQRGFRVALAARGAFVPGDVGPSQVPRLLRALALVRPEAGPLPAPPAAVTVRVRPGAAPVLDGPAPDRRAQA